MQAAHPAAAGASGAAGGTEGAQNTQDLAGPALPATEHLQTRALHCTVGPDSVGCQLAREALCFGGQAATATDAAVLLGCMEVAGASPAAVEAAGLRRDQAEAAWQAMQEALERAVDEVKTQAGKGAGWRHVAAMQEGLDLAEKGRILAWPWCCGAARHAPCFQPEDLATPRWRAARVHLKAGDVPVVVVGGGAPLCGATLAGASCVLRPAHASVANAVGAAIAQVTACHASNRTGNLPVCTRASVFAEMHCMHD